MLRVVYYTHPHFLELALHFAREMAKVTEFHLMLEVSPGAWEKGLFDLKERPLPEGIVPARPLLEAHFPPSVAAYWKNVASFNLVSSVTPRSVHPRPVLTSHKAAAFINELRPDLLHIEDIDTSMRLAFATLQLRRLPIVLNVHDPAPHTGEHNWRKSFARRILYPHVDRFVLHNRSQAAGFASRYGLAPWRVAVNHLGVYEIAREMSDEDVATDGGNVLFFGRISQYKGLPTLLEAAPRVLERVPNASFTGAGQVSANMRDTPIESGRMHFLGRYINNRELGDLFQKTAVIACPYTDATQSGVILNAYGFGKPVVASSVGGIPEYVDDGESGLLVPPNDPDALADALMRVLTDEKLNARLRRGVEALRTGRLSWERMAGETLDTYESVLMRRRRRQGSAGYAAIF